MLPLKLALVSLSAATTVDGLGTCAAGSTTSGGVAGVEGAESVVEGVKGAGSRVKFSEPSWLSSNTAQWDRV